MTGVLVKVVMCGLRSGAPQNTQVLFENYPLTPGTDFSVIIRGDTLEPLDDVTVKTKITVAGIFSIMDLQNLCKGPGKRCPYSPGPQEQRLTCTTWYSILLYLQIQACDLSATWIGRATLLDRT